MKTETFIPTRSSLLKRLKNWEDQESWQEFFNLYGKLILGALPPAQRTSELDGVRAFWKQVGERATR